MESKAVFFRGSSATGYSPQGVGTHLPFDSIPDSAWFLGDSAVRFGYFATQPGWVKAGFPRHRPRHIPR